MTLNDGLLVVGYGAWDRIDYVMMMHTDINKRFIAESDYLGTVVNRGC
jgi:beta-glucosidase/6-phospho-beta-glucosidase/beta-galactosidase